MARYGFFHAVRAKVLFQGGEPIPLYMNAKGEKAAITDVFEGTLNQVQERRLSFPGTWMGELGQKVGNATEAQLVRQIQELSIRRYNARAAGAALEARHRERMAQRARSEPKTAYDHILDDR